MKQAKKVLSLVLALAMLAGLLTVGAFAVDPAFEPVSIAEGESVKINWTGNTGTVANVEVGNSYIPGSFTLYVEGTNSISTTGSATYSNLGDYSGNTAYKINLNGAGTTITATITASAFGKEGTYTVTCPAPNGAAPGGATPSAFMGYLPLGQYARTGTAWASPFTDAAAGAGTGTPKIVGGFSSTGVSLGAAGGYVQYAFDSMIEDNPSNPYGVDFVVYGNAFNGNPEAGSVQVSPNGTDWYELAGSLYYSDKTIRNATITYTLSGSDILYTITAAQLTAPITGTFKAGGSAWFPTQANYGSVWKLGSANVIAGSYTDTSVTYSGVTLVKDTDATSDYQFGYADVHVNGSGYGAAVNPYTIANTAQGGDGYDLAWAVNSDGTPAHLSGAKYVRVYTSAAMNADGTAMTVPGIFGETSAEVCGIYVANSGENAGMTAAPTVMVGNAAVTPGTATAVDVTVEADTDISISATASSGVIFVNSASGTGSAELTVTLERDESKIIRIIAQDGTNNAAYVGYINLITE